ncbi:MAG: geopeptide radical SAM maturase [Proteobacteria bacterium]|nr:geopeptide radical SAM maturase [Pseudomonadota bacterium]MBU4295601.1 geopeptide radical SAM maturase [Pseudomonadota bacterium]MCG2746792.1 geopeptide radical SAM maturase [Desulfobulbaceae bacterium]
MQLTPYQVVCRHRTIPGQVLLFATKTGALILLAEEDFAALEKGQAVDEEIEQLSEIGFLVADADTEQRQVMHYMDDINRLNPNLTLALVLGMECNFACRYCFEGSQKGGKAMDDATADQLVTFIKQRFGPGKKKLLLQIYGGEPLLYRKRLISLARQLKPIVEARGGELKIDLVSNGSLLTAQVVEELNAWGLDGVKVTLDGLPDNHNHFRPFKSGRESFAVIVRNLANVCGLTKIRLGGNYTNETYTQFGPLLDHLSEQGLTPDKVELVNFNIVLKVNDKLTANEYHGGCATINEPWLREASLHVREEVYRRGYTVPELGPQPCAVEVDDAFTVHYDGSLYKCVTWVGHRQFRIGDIWQGVDEKYRQTHHLLHWQKEGKCQACVYLPLCFGGCRFMAYQRDGHMGKVDCRKSFLDATLEAMLLQDLRYKYGYELFYREP